MSIQKTIVVAALLLSSATAQAETASPDPHWATKEGVVTFSPTVPDLEQTDVLDIIKIEDAYKRWGMYYDEGLMHLLPTIFAENGTLKLYVGSGEIAGEISGVAAIGDFLSNTIEAQGDQRRHLMTNVLVESISNGKAETIAYGAVLVANKGMSLDISAIYSGSLEKSEDGVWRFTSLTIAMDSYSGSVD